jgi:hypothetical protein
MMTYGYPPELVVLEPENPAEALTTVRQAIAESLLLAHHRAVHLCEDAILPPRGVALRPAGGVVLARLDFLPDMDTALVTAYATADGALRAVVVNTIIKGSAMLGSEVYTFDARTGSRLHPRGLPLRNQ